MPSTILPEPSLKVGDKYRFSGKRLIHIRGFVDEQVVYRHWHKIRGWEYEVEQVEYFDPKYGFYTKVK